MKTRKLRLPDGGTFTIPMHGFQGPFVDNSFGPGAFAGAGATCPNLAATILIPLSLGLVLGAGVTWLIHANSR